MGFFNHFTQACDGTSATLEVLFGLGIATLLGYLLGRFLSQEKSMDIDNNTDVEHADLSSTQVFSTSNNTNEVIDLKLKLDNANLEINRLRELNAKTESDLKTCYDNTIAMAKRYDVSVPTITKVESITISPPVIAAPIVEAVKVEEPIIVIPIVETPVVEVAKVEEAIIETQIVEAVKEEEVKEVVEVIATKEVVKKSTSKKVTVIDTDGTKKKDDLKIIEGIGPAIEKLFNENGIFTFSEMIAAGVMKMNSLMDGNPRFRVHDASTWVDQAMLLDQGRIAEFEKLTAKLKGGKKK